MRDPRNLNHIDYNDQAIEVLKFDQIPEYDLQDYDLNDEREFKKYTKRIEQIIRTSFEYKAMINYLREYLDMNKCSFYANVNNIDTYKIKIHIHHEPITLFDIVMAVYNKRSAYRESISEDMVAKEVMYLHYRMMVGLIPLAETVHELVHNQYLFVPTSAVFGKYKEFVTEYDEFIPPETKDTLKTIEEYSENYSFHQAESILNKNMIYVDLTGAYNLPKYEDIIANMNTRISDIKNNKQDDNLITVIHKSR